MKALSIRQPWPWAIFSAPPQWRKDVENRSWWTSQHGRVAIHVSQRPGPKRWDEDWDGYCETVGSFPRSFCDDRSKLIPHTDDLPFGVLIGTVEIVDCTTNHASPWFFGPYGFVLREPRLFPQPIPFRGAQKFFDVPDGILPNG